MNKIKETPKNNKSASGFRAIDFFMLGFGSMIGVGWTVALNDWFSMAGGVIGAVIAFIIGTLMVIPVGLCYGEMTGAMPVSGGTMAFAYRAEGSKLSFLGGWLMALAYIVLLPWEMIYINHIISLLFPVLTSGSPLYVIFGHEVYLGSLLVGIGITSLFVYLNIKGAEISGKLQTRMTSTILLAALIIIVFAFIKADFSNLFPVYSSPVDQEHSGFIQGILSMLVIVPFFMAGFDAIPQAVEDANDDIEPKRISRIIVFTIAAAGLFYVIIMLASGSAIPWKTFANLDTPALAFMFDGVYGDPLGTILYYVTIIGALAGLLSTFNGMFIAATRLLFSMGRSELIPKTFSKKSKSDTPVTAILFAGAATLIGPFFGTSVIAPLTNVGSLSFVLGWLITSYSTLKLRNTEENLHRPIKAGKGKGVIYLSILVSSALAILSVVPSSPGFMSYESLIIFVIWVAIGFIFHYISENTGETISERKRFNIIFRELDTEGTFQEN